MEKTTIIILNSISALPILVYPFILFSSIFLFDSPQSGKSAAVWVIALLMWLYPIFIGILIFLSQRYHSLSLAIIALIPLLVFIYVFFIAGGSNYKARFDVASRDFVCDANSFITIDGKGNPISGVFLIEKKNFFTYTQNEIGSIYKSTSFYPNSMGKLTPDELKDQQNKVSMCKNSDGKTLTEVYTVINKDQMRQIIQSFQ